MILMFWFLILTLTDRYGVRIVAHINRVCPELLCFFMKITNVFALIDSSIRQNKYLFKKIYHKQTMLSILMVWPEIIFIGINLIVCLSVILFLRKYMFVNAILKIMHSNYVVL
jgi:hypothetical protein